MLLKLFVLNLAGLNVCLEAIVVDFVDDLHAWLGPFSLARRLFRRDNRNELVIDFIVLGCEHSLHHCFAFELIISLRDTADGWVGIGLGLRFG